MVFTKKWDSITWVSMESTHTRSNVRWEMEPIRVYEYEFTVYFLLAITAKSRQDKVRSSFHFMKHFPHALPVFPTVTTFIDQEKITH